MIMSFVLFKSEVGICFPIGIRHIYHLLVAPDDLYDPIITDKFLFDKMGFQKTYTLHPKYFDLYDLSIVFLDGDISSKYKFSGKLSVEFLHKGNIVSQKIVDRIVTAGYAGKDMSKYNRIALLTYGIPIVGKFKDDISLRVTVLEVDQELKKYKNSIVLQVAVSPTP